MEQRRIILTVLEDKQANSVAFAESNLCIGYAGEHLATILGFNLPENWLNQNVKYQICFRTSDGKCYSTDLLDIAELALPSGIMIAGALYVQVLATDSDGTVIKKTEVCKCTVGKSIADGEIIAKYDGVKLASLLTEELQAAIGAAKEAQNNLMSSVATASGVKTSVESATKSANTAITNLQSATSVANTAKTSLETATENANTAKTNLETAITNAATATTSANNAAASANSASAAATNAASEANTAAENLQADISDANGKLSAINDAISKLQQSAIKKYSVSFSGSLSAGTRLDDAVGMRADVQIGTDASGVVNDFDNVSFFNRPICCCSWDSTNRKWRVNAYEGEPGFTRDGSNGEVMYECTPFWYRADFEGEGAPRYVSVTGTPCEGYTLAPMFKNGYDKVYCSSYWMSMVDGKATSRSGTYGTYGSLNLLISNARTLDEKAHLETIEMLFSDYLLMLVEFATKDFQTVMLGACSMRYDQNDVVMQVTTGNGHTNIRIENCDIKNFVVGQTISVGTTKNGENHVRQARVESVNGGDTVTNIQLGGEETSIAIGDYVSSRPWINGATDIITASIGTIANDGKHPCIWRGKVDPWGDAFSAISNLLVKRYGDGTDDSPYSYRLHYLPDPCNYANGAITSDYIEANYDLETANGYVKTLSTDSRYPYLIGTTLTGASSTSYAAAYYFGLNGNSGITFVRYGGSISNSRSCSPVSFLCSNPPSSSSWSSRARLLCSP